MFLYRNEESIDLETVRVINSLSLSFFSEKRYLIDKVRLLGMWFFQQRLFCLLCMDLGFQWKQNRLKSVIK